MAPPVHHWRIGEYRLGGREPARVGSVRMDVFDCAQGATRCAQPHARAHSEKPDPGELSAVAASAAVFPFLSEQCLGLGGLHPQYVVTRKIAKFLSHSLEVLSYQLVFRFAPHF